MVIIVFLNFKAIKHINFINFKYHHMEEEFNLNYLWFLLILLPFVIALLIYLCVKPGDPGGWKITGHVEPGFEEVRQQFESYFKFGHDANS